MSVGNVKQWRIGPSYGARERDLRLDARDAVDREPVLALEIPHQIRQVSIEHIAHWSVAVQSLYMLETLPQPAYISTVHSR